MKPFESEALYRRLIDNAPLGVLSVDREGRIQTVNRRLLEMLGSPSEEATRDINLLSFPPLVEAGISSVARHCLDTGEHGIGDLPYVSAWGKPVHFRFHFAPLLGPDGGIEGLHALVEDVTEQRRTEAELRDSRRMLRSVLDTIPTRVFWKDLDLVYLGCNRRFAEDAGLDDPLEIVGKTDHELPWPEQVDLFRADDRQVIQSGQAKLGCEEPWTRPDGTRTWIQTNRVPLRDAESRIVGVLGTYEDITQRKAHEQELRWRSEFERLLVSLATDFLHLPPEQLDEGIERALAAVREFTGDDICYVFALSETESLGRVIYEALGPEVRSLEDALGSVELDELPKMVAAFRRGEIVHVPDIASDHDFDTYRFESPGGAGLLSTIGLPILSDGRLRAVLGFASVRETKTWSSDGIALLRVLGEIIGNALDRRRNEAEREALQAQLRQAQKLEAIGTLAGGIAHDFNNLLTAILGRNELALSRLPGGSELREDLGEVQRAAERARHLVDRILTFSRRAERDPRPIDVVPVVREALDLLRAALPSTIAIELTLPNEPVIIRADPTEIHQVVMNIATNAGQAMSAGGKLEISLAVVEFDVEERAGEPRRLPGLHADLCVRDSGAGLDAETALRIFDPYFTTKEIGQGTGLGLAMVHGIVSALGGEVKVESQPGEGAEFHVFLPISAATPAERPSSATIVVGGGERVLFVDDEPAIQSWGRRALERLGYRVRVCGDGNDALRCLRSEVFDVVVTDQTMPGCTGLELARQLQLLHPDLPVVLLTGLLDPETAAEARQAGVTQLLAKPPSLAEFAQALRGALDRG